MFCLLFYNTCHRMSLQKEQNYWIQTNADKTFPKKNYIGHKMKFSAWVENENYIARSKFFFYFWKPNKMQQLGNLLSMKSTIFVLNCSSLERMQTQNTLYKTSRTIRTIRCSFMTEIIFIVVKPKQPNFGQPIWHTTRGLFIWKWKPIQLFIGN